MFLQEDGREKSTMNYRFIGLVSGGILNFFALDTLDSSHSSIEYFMTLVKGEYPPENRFFVAFSERETI